MPPLAEIQRSMRRAIVAGDAGELARLLVGGRDPRQRLAIHQRHYESSLVTALLGKFPATVWLVGSEFVTEAARRFVHDRPPERPCVAEYGEDFPMFLAVRPGADRVPYLKDFAELEWHVGQVSIAIQQPGLPLGDVAGADAESLSHAVLTTQPGLRYLHATYAVDELMKLYLSDSAPDTFRLDAGDVWIEIRGARGDLRINRLDRAAFMFRRSIGAGRSIGEAAEGALDADPSFNAGLALIAMIGEGLITGIAKIQVGETI